MKPKLLNELNELEKVFNNTQLSDHVGYRKIFERVNELAMANPTEKNDLRAWMDRMIVKYHKITPLEWVCNVGFYDLLKYMWRRCFQIVVWDEGKGENDFPNWFGCGFVIKYQDEFLFVTADHVIHKEEHESGVANNKKLTYGLVCNIADVNEWRFFIKPLQEFHYADRLNVDDICNSGPELGVQAIPNRIDIAYCRVNIDVVSQCMTHDLSCDNDVLVEAGLSKNYIDEKTFAKADKQHTYIVMGTFINEPSCGMLWKRCNAICTNIRYIGEDQYNEELIFEEPTNSGIDDWQGLSGSPLFTDDGKFVGMLIRHSKDVGTLRVMSIHKILEFVGILRTLETK